MQTGFNQAFGGLSDAASINSSNAFYPVGGIRNFRSPLEGFVRYDWDLPPPFDTYLRNAVVNSPAFAKGDIFIMRIEDLQSLRTFQVVPSRDCTSRNPDDKTGDIWSITRRNYAAHPRYCMYEGALIKSSTSLLVTLDYSAVPCEPQKIPLQTLATRLFGDDGFLLFKGPAGAMVPFCDAKPQAASLASTALPQDGWPFPRDPVRMPSDRCLVENAAPMTESLHSVKIVMGLLGLFLSIDKVITSSNVATVYQRKYQKRDSALLAHGFSYRGISARCLEPDHVSREKILQPHTDEKHPNDLIAIFQCGGTLGAGAFVTQLMELQEKLDAPRDQISQWNTEDNTPKIPTPADTSMASPPSPPLFPPSGATAATTPSQPQALPVQPHPVRHHQATTTHRPRQRCILRPKGTPMTNNSPLLYSKHTRTTQTAQT